MEDTMPRTTQNSAHPTREELLDILRDGGDRDLYYDSVCEIVEETEAQYARLLGYDPEIMKDEVSDERGLNGY